MAVPDEGSYEHGVHAAWVGELQGEAFFDALAQTASGTAQEKWRTLAQLEQVTGERLATVLHARNVDLSPPEAPGELLAAAKHYAELPFADAVSAMRPILVAAIDRFKALLDQAPDAERETMRFLVDHEQALLSFVDMEASGQGDRSLAPAQALIAACRRS